MAARSPRSSGVQKAIAMPEAPAREEQRAPVERAAERLRSLASARLRHKPGTPFVTEKDLFFLSVPNPQFPGIQLTETGALDHTYKYRRQAGHLDRQDTLNIPMTPEKLPPTSRHLIQSRLPATWSRLVSP
jgi:hypothetical protein